MQHRLSSDRLGPRGEAMAEAVSACVHCGFCLPTCPTYQTLGEEMDSPRGRIVLMKSMLEGDLELQQGLPFIDRCLGCVACVTACPSGVEYGDLLTAFRAHAEPRRERSTFERLLRALVLETLSRPGLMRFATRTALPFRRLAALLPARFARLKAALALLPERLPKPQPLPATVSPEAGPSETVPPETVPPAPVSAEAVPGGASKPVRRVALLRGCAQDVLAPGIQRAAASVLARRGVEVSIPPDQGCCGALALHSGHEPPARRRALDLMAAFAGVETLITTAAGCGSGIADYPLLFAGTEHEAAARRLADSSLDVSSYLHRLEPVPSRAARPLIAVYQDACHLAHAQGERRSPRRLLEAIEGLELRTAEPWHLCCGSAGIYNLEQPEIAGQLGRQKAEAILATGAELVISGNIGCIMQIRHHLAELCREAPRPPQRPPRVLHTVEVLDLAERGELGI